MLLNYTTNIDPDKTAMEISRILSSHGASAVMTEYDPVDGYVTALSFKVKIGDKDLAFRLPSDWQPVFTILTKGKKPRYSYDSASKKKFEDQWQQQAKRVAWRIVKDWVEAQMALVETRMVTTAQVFLPYAVMRDGKTLAETVATNPQFLLGDGNQ